MVHPIARAEVTFVSSLLLIVSTIISVVIAMVIGGLLGITSGFSGGTGAAFALVPAQNATGNWIKVVQRLPVPKGIEAVPTPDTPLGDRTDMVYMNTSVTRGSGELVVTATGMATVL